MQRWARLCPRAAQELHHPESTDGVYYNKALNTLAITKSGVTFDGYDFRGVSINVQADNVTIKNSTFDASVGKYAINALTGTKNLTVDRSTFDGLKLDNIGYVDFIMSRGHNTVLTNNAFLDAPSDAIAIQSGTISGNYISGGSYATGAHADAIWIGKTIGSVVIADNVIDWRSRADAPTETNEAVRITGELGNVSNVLVKNNILLGGSMTVLVSDGATQTHNAGQVGTVTGVKIVENVIDFGKYGDLKQTSRPKDMVYADNMHASGRPAIPARKPSRPAPTCRPSRKSTPPRPLRPSSAPPRATTSRAAAARTTSTPALATTSSWAAAVATPSPAAAARTLSSTRPSRMTASTASPTSRRAGQDPSGKPRRRPKDHTDWQWLESRSFTGHDWQLRYGYASGATTIEIDANGDLKADFKLELTGKVALKTSDFILAEKGSALPPTSGTDAPTAPPVTPSPVETPKPSAPTKPAEPAPPVQSADPTLVLQAPSSGGHVNGKASDELILGSAKADGLRGGGGDDVLVGRGGKDILYGGAGQDTFRFEKLSDSLAAGSGRDYIGDFVRGEDKIDLHAIDADALTATNDAFTWIGSDTFTKNAGELRSRRSPAAIRSRPTSMAMERPISRSTS